MATGEEGERPLLSPQILGRVNWVWGGEAVDSQSLPHSRPHDMLLLARLHPAPITATLTRGLGDQAFKYLSLGGTFPFKPPHRDSITTL